MDILNTEVIARADKDKIRFSAYETQDKSRLLSKMESYEHPLDSPVK